MPLKTDRITEIYERHVDTLWRLAFSFMKNSADTEDIVQDTFLRLIKSGKEFESVDHEKAWLIKTASNLCKDALKHWWRKKEDFETAEFPDYEDGDNEVLKVVLSLPKDYAAVVYMHYYEGYTTPEIADFLSLSEAGTRSRFSGRGVYLKHWWRNNMKNRIKTAYAKLVPTPGVKERMLRNLLKQEENAPQMSKNLHMFNKKRVICIAAAAVLCVGMIVTAYAAEMFGLKNLVFERKEYSGENAENNTLNNFEDDSGITEIPETKPDYDTISLQGIAGSSEFLAAEEWWEFYSSYDVDGAILKAIGNKPTPFDEKYGTAYICYSQEMADKIDGICEKYGLVLHTGVTVAMEVGPEFFKAAGVGNVLPEKTDASRSSSWGYFYEDGTFQFEGETMLLSEDAGWEYPINYQFRRTVKGVFDTTGLNIENAEDYTEWNYTTKDGVQLFLAKSPDKAVVIAERAESFVVINVLDTRVGDIHYGELTMPVSALESFCETFDFAAIG